MGPDLQFAIEEVAKSSADASPACGGGSVTYARTRLLSAKNAEAV